MIVITGGAYQGKRQFAIDTLGVDADSLYTVPMDCNSDELVQHSVIYGLERYILAVLGNGGDPLEKIKEILPRIKDSVIISDDISCGVVPTDGSERQWREAVGRCMVLLSREASEVYRVFCGLGTRLK